jgi:hypothetical protein
MASAATPINVAIVYELSLHKERLICIQDLYDKITGYECAGAPSADMLQYKKAFQLALLNIHNDFTLIQLFKARSDNQYFVVWTVNDRGETARLHNMEELRPTELINFITRTDILSYIECTFGTNITFNPNKLVYGDRTACQVVVEAGATTTLRLFANIYRIDFDVRTPDGLTLFDIARKNNDIATLEELYIAKQTQDMEDFDATITDYKSICKRLYNYICISGVVIIVNVVINMSNIIKYM